MITKKTKIIFVVSIICFLVSVGGVYMLWSTIKNQGEALAQKANELALFEAQNKSYRDLEQLVNDTQSQRTQLQEYLLTEDQTIDFLSKIENLADSLAIDLSTDALKVQDTEGPFDTLLISYRIEGMKTRVDTLIQMLETLPYQAGLSNLSFQYDFKDGVSVTTGTFTLAITLVTI